MYIQIEKFILGSLLGLVVPISLVWAQYVHPLDFPKIPQLEKIPSDYLLHIQLGSSFEELDQDNGWIELKEESFHSDYEIAKFPPTYTSNSINALSGDFLPSPDLLVIPPITNYIMAYEPEVSLWEMNKFISHTDEIPQSGFISASKYYDPVNDSILSSTFAPTPFALTVIKPEIPPNKQNKYVKDDSQNIEGSKNYLNSFHVQNLAHDYPDYSPSAKIPEIRNFDIFDSNIVAEVNTEIYLQQDINVNLSKHTETISNKRNRRATYTWEMTDFEDYESDNKNDRHWIGIWPGDSLTIILKPLSSGDVGTGTTNNTSATEGLAENMPEFPDPEIWTPSVRTYQDAFSITGSVWPTSITIDDSKMKYYMNWYYGDWSYTFEKITDSRYDFDLVYYSAVPEPSTYFMTGALFCFIGFNRSSRNAFKSMLSKVFMHWKTKDNTEDVLDRIS